MAIRDIYNDIVGSSSTGTIQTDIRNNTEKVIVHFPQLKDIDETQFDGIEDPIIIYKTVEELKVISVLPFKETEATKAALPFEDKIQYFRQRNLSMRRGFEVSSVPADTEVTTLIATNYGTLADFQAAFNDPVNNDVTLTDFFGGLFLDLKPESFTELQAGLDETLV